MSKMYEVFLYANKITKSIYVLAEDVQDARSKTEAYINKHEPDNVEVGWIQLAQPAFESKELYNGHD